MRNTKRKKRTKCWIKEAVFDNAVKAEVSLGNTWSKHYTNYSDIGRKVYYRCRKSKLRGPQCSAGIYLLYHAESDQVSIYKTETDHDHHERKVRGIDENVNKCIEDLFNDGITKPKQIIRALQTRNFELPSYVQIKNFLVQYKKTKFGSYIVSLGESEQWCKQNINISTDENKYFVVSYKIMYNDEEDVDGNKFRVFLSTVRLLNIASISSHIHADATYKLIWQGFPALIIGATDLKKVFHPFGLAICSNEKTKDFKFIFNSIQIGLEKIKKDLLKPSALVSDAADSIKNGFKNVFKDEYNQIMCWSHMKMKVQNRICHIDDKAIADEMMNDIEMLQLSNSSTVFELALTLFMKKEPHVRSRFLVIASNIINNWSIERDPSSTNAKVFPKEPTICLNL
ncbi:unnamed protein product [Rotaria sordida]|uniref:MULE transposase domain-containing protein n=1 Tax=Rotaria sordida TaxID=392033 RepID=A0A814TD95_9BILA|nr:unnamed protein product [Rotaria sordida]CAF3665006.1 unnamed protein product [Rotaria sordida]